MIGAPDFDRLDVLAGSQLVGPEIRARAEIPLACQPSVHDFIDIVAERIPYLINSILSFVSRLSHKKVLLLGGLTAQRDLPLLGGQIRRSHDV